MNQKNSRPSFEKIKTVSEFESHYWYREELKLICKNIKIPSSGAKADLEERLKLYIKFGREKFLKTLQDVSIPTAVRRKAHKPNKIGLTSKIIPEGIRFDSQFREFCRIHFKLNKFSFTKSMAEAVRDAEKSGNLNLTVQDLLEIYKNPPKEERPDDRVLRWNRFVKDFHKDSKTKFLKNKLNVAAFLWKKIRDRPGNKKFQSSLLEEFSDQIKKIENMKHKR